MTTKHTKTDSEKRAETDQQQKNTQQKSAEHKTDLERAKERENRKEHNFEKEEISTWNDEGGNSAQYADKEGKVPADGGNSTENSSGENCDDK